MSGKSWKMLAAWVPSSPRTMEQYRCCRRRLFVRSSDPRSGSGGEGRRKGERLVRGATACGEMGTPQPHQSLRFAPCDLSKIDRNVAYAGCCSTGSYLV